MANYSFIQYNEKLFYPDGIYNALYNKEPSIIRIEKGKPVWVQFIGFMKNDEPRCSSIFDAKGIMSSSVELLVKAQTI
jgi:hypothetical protein